MMQDRGGGSGRGFDLLCHAGELGDGARMAAAAAAAAVLRRRWKARLFAELRSDDGGDLHPCDSADGVTLVRRWRSSRCSVDISDCHPHQRDGRTRLRDTEVSLTGERQRSETTASTPPSLSRRSAANVAPHNLPLGASATCEQQRPHTSPPTHSPSAVRLSPLRSPERHSTACPCTGHRCRRLSACDRGTWLSAMSAG